MKRGVMLDSMIATDGSRNRARTRWLSALVLVFAACSSNPDGSATDGGPQVTGDGTISCQNDPRNDTYVAKLQKPGASGTWKFVLVQSDPAPPGKGNNTWTLRVLDKSDRPVTDAAIDVKPFMPEHGHGTSVAAKATLAAEGSYTVTPLYFFMPGLWQVTFTATAGALNDSAVFTFCVQG